MSKNISSNDNIKFILSYPFLLILFYSSIIKNRALPIIAATRNWVDVFLVYYGFAASKEIYFKNGKSMELNKENMDNFKTTVELYGMPEAMRKKYEVSYDGKTVSAKIDGTKLKLDPYSAPQIIHEFYYSKHAMLDVSGKEVVDIGAYVGDTPIFYLFKGAKHVYAYEPYLQVYKIALANIKSNNLSSKISLFNYAVSGREGNANVNASTTIFTNVDEKTNAEGDTKKILVVSLDALSEEFEINHGALKVDCEGCEYNIFKDTSSSTLQRFDFIHVEYHYGYLDIVERLNTEGFEVEHTNPTYRFVNGLSEPMVMGDIFAKRKL